VPSSRELVDFELTRRRYAVPRLLLFSVSPVVVLAAGSFRLATPIGSTPRSPAGSSSPF